MNQMERDLKKLLSEGYSVDDIQELFELSEHSIAKGLKLIRDSDIEFYEKISNPTYRACLYMIKQNGKFEVALRNNQITSEEFWREFNENLLNSDKLLYIQTRNKLYQQGIIKKDE